MPRAYIMHQNYLEPYKFDMQAQEQGYLKQQKFAINKALEQKLIGPMKESHTKEQSPQAVVGERSRILKFSTHHQDQSME